MSTTTNRTQPALIGGLVMGVLSALPIISAGNACCCLWVVSGGVVAAYVLQQNQVAPITAGDGAQIGFLAGMAGALVYLVLSIPITILIAPFERAVMQRILENARNMPVEVEGYVRTLGTGVRILLGFVFMVCVGAVFSTLGGVLGVAMFKKRPPAGPVDVATAH